jgi:hypothetical protein
MALKSAISSMISLVGVLKTALATRVSAMWNAFDIRPVFFFGGLLMLGYGLFLYLPWVSFSVCGLILMAVGYLMRSGGAKP